MKADIDRFDTNCDKMPGRIASAGFFARFLTIIFHFAGKMPPLQSLCFHRSEYNHFSVRKVAPCRRFSPSHPSGVHMQIMYGGIDDYKYCLLYIFYLIFLLCLQQNETNIEKLQTEPFLISIGVMEAVKFL